MKIFHIVCHTMEQYYPFLKQDISGFSILEHSVNFFVKNLHIFDTENEHILVNLSITVRERKDFTHTDGYKVIVLPGRYFGNEFLQYSTQLIEFVKSTEGIFHIHGTSNFLFDIVSSKIESKKAIAHHRGGHFTLKAFPLSFPKYFFSFPLALRNYKKILVENELRKKKFTNFYKLRSEKIEVIPGTIDTQQYQLKSTFPSKVRSFLYVGRVEKNKGIYDLLEVFSKLPATYTLDIVGDGSALCYAKEKYLKYSNITFHGYLQPSEVRKILPIKDVFIHPSYSDSFGLAVLEALTVGLTVISTNVEGPKSILCDGNTQYGHMYTPGDKKGLQECINKSLVESIRQRETRAKEGRKRVEGNFTFNIVLSKLQKVYSSL